MIVLDRDGCKRSHKELQIRSAILCRGMPDGILVNIHPDLETGSSREHPGTVSFSGSEVEDTLCLCQCCGISVPVEMFVRDRAFPNPGKEAFTCPFQHSVHAPNRPGF